MRFAKWTFTIAGIYGLLAIVPQYFLEARIARDMPPAITHPEYFYGFAGVTLAFQILFLLIGRDPIRYRPVMAVSIVEKISFVIAAVVLRAQGRMPNEIFAAAMIDLMWAVLFAVAFVKTATAKSSQFSARSATP